MPTTRSQKQKEEKNNNKFDEGIWGQKQERNPCQDHSKCLCFGWAPCGSDFKDQAGYKLMISTPEKIVSVVLCRLDPIRISVEDLNEVHYTDFTCVLKFVSLDPVTNHITVRDDRRVYVYHCSHVIAICEKE